MIPLQRSQVGKLVQGAGFSFVLAPGAAQQPRIRFNIRPAYLCRVADRP